MSLADAAASPQPQRMSSAAQGATFAIVVLTAMNLLNYFDRWVPSAVKPLFQADLGLTDAQTSYPLTAFVVVYMLASPVFGALADKFPRRVLIAAGVALWSAATAGAAFATGFWTFLFARALVGVGEAAYATISPALIADFYPAERRNRVLTIFYVAIPVGSALGFGVGGVLGQAFGWRTAFLACGIPGILAAALCLFMREPVRGGFDREAAAPALSWPEAIRALRKSGEYVWSVGGYVLVTFASGAFADWAPAYLNRYRGMDVAEAGRIMGIIAVVGGLGGTVAGGLLADRLRKRTRQPYFALSAISMLLATVFIAAGFVVGDLWTSLALMTAGQFFMWCYNSPINAVIVNSVGAGLRARAFSLSILAIHILGDAISPPIVGEISGATGRLDLALWLVPLTLLLGAIIWTLAWRRLPERTEAA